MTDNNHTLPESHDIRMMTRFQLIDLVSDLQQQLQTVQQENERQREKIIEISAPGWQQAFKRVEELKAERDKLSATVKELTDANAEMIRLLKLAVPVIRHDAQLQDNSEEQVIALNLFLRDIDAALSRTQEHD